MSNASLLGGNNVVSFEGVSADLRADIMDCLLYAQLSADKQHDRSHQWKSWMDQYQRVIYQKGSQLTGAINPNYLKIESLRELRYLPINATGVATSPQLQALLRHSFDILMNSEHARTFFSSWFTQGRSESFQVIPCKADGEDSATILICGLQMTTRALVPAYYFWKMLAGDMTVTSNGASFRFTAKGYEPYREPIREYLASQVRKEIIDL
jgi:hypothetical protein